MTLAELDALQRRAKHPASAATLHRTLALLVEVELASRTTGEDGAGRYTPR